MARLDRDTRNLSILRGRLADAEAVLSALRGGAADALIGEDGDIFHLTGSEKPYITFFTAMNEGGVTLDGAGTILHCNPRFCAMLGWSIDVLRGMAFSACIARSDWPQLQNLLASRTATAGEVVLDGPGGPVPVRLSLQTIQAGPNQFLCVVVTDLSERTKIEAELRIAAIAFEAQEAMVVTNADGIVVRINRGFAELTGYEAAQVVGHSLSLLKSDRHDAEFYRQIREGLKATGRWQGEIWNRRQNGEDFVQWLMISAVTTPEGEVTHYIGAYSQVTRDKEVAAEIHRLAYYDPLTGLPNRRLLLDRLKQALAGSTRSGRSGAVLFLDLDQFKTLNDTRGHAAGDQLLREVAQRLRHCLRDSDTIARLGGDEFLLILKDLSEDGTEAAMQARQIGEKIRDTLAQPYIIEAQDYRVTASIGVSLFRRQESSVEELLKQADLALYKAKDSGRNTIRFFDPIMQETLDHQVALENDLRLAIARKELRLYYQPLVDATRQVVGAEILLRWHHPERGLVMPQDFIPLAEKSGLILPIGHWVMEQACHQITAWSQAGCCPPALTVNVSLYEFREPDFVASLQAVLDRTGADPACLKLELTESLMAEDIQDTTEKLQALKALGIQVSIDDFGTGYSSLSYLVRLPIDQLKIDRSFVLHLPENSRDAVIAQTIITMARNLSLNVIAEGVETEAQLEFLSNNGCRVFQGYLFSPPLPLAAFEAAFPLSP